MSRSLISQGTPTARAMSSPCKTSSASQLICATIPEIIAPQWNSTQ